MIFGDCGKGGGEGANKTNKTFEVQKEIYIYLNVLRVWFDCFLISLLLKDGGGFSVSNAKTCWG